MVLDAHSADRLAKMGLDGITLTFRSTNLMSEDTMRAAEDKRGVTPEDRLGIDLARSELNLVRQLVAVRQRRGLKPAELARRMGVDRSVVTRFESGGTNPTMATISRYAEVVGAMIHYTVEQRPQAVAKRPLNIRELSFTAMPVEFDERVLGANASLGDMPTDDLVRRLLAPSAAAAR